MAKLITPIVSIMDTTTRIVESYESGKEFWKHIWKYPKKLTGDKPNFEITFGHKFFHWCNKNNRKVWIQNCTGININDWDQWSVLTGEIVQNPNSFVEHKHFLIVRVINARKDTRQ